MNRARLLFQVAILALLAPLASPAKDVVVGVEDLPYLPYYASERGQYRGFARDLLDAFAADRGHVVRYRPLPVERLYRDLLDGDIDLKLPDHPDWRPDLKSGHEVRYSAPLAPFVDGVLVLPGRLAENPDRIRRIGTVRGFTPWPLLGDIEQGKVVMSENDSIPGLLRQVLAGRIDGAFINVAVARFHLSEIGGDPNALVLHPALPVTRSDYRVSSLRHPDLVAELDAWLARHPERLSALHRAWGIGDPPTGR